MTTIQKMIRVLESMNRSANDYENMVYDIMKEELDKAFIEEELMINNAIMHALRNTEHKNEWKIKFADRYYQMLKRIN